MGIQELGAEMVELTAGYELLSDCLPTRFHCFYIYRIHQVAIDVEFLYSLTVLLVF